MDRKSLEHSMAWKSAFEFHFTVHVRQSLLMGLGPVNHILLSLSQSDEVINALHAR